MALPVWGKLGHKVRVQLLTEETVQVLLLSRPKEIFASPFLSLSGWAG